MTDAEPNLGPMPRNARALLEAARAGQWTEGVRHGLGAPLPTARTPNPKQISSLKITLSRAEYRVVALWTDSAFMFAYTWSIRNGTGQPIKRTYRDLLALIKASSS